MSDLISRSELIKHFEAIQQQENVVGLEFIAMIDEIKEQPTAYDVDKVVEKLKIIKEDALAEYSMGEYNLDNNIGNSIAENYRKDMNEGKCFAYDEAIEIVKQGDVPDDTDNVCECRKFKDCNSLFKTSCGYIFAREGFKFCPYCGKKIKIKAVK